VTSAQTDRLTDTAAPVVEALKPLLHLPDIDDIAGALRHSTATLQVKGVRGSFKSILFAALFRKLQRQVIVICPDTASAQEVWSDTELFLDNEDALFIGERFSATQKAIRNISSAFAENADTLRLLSERPLRLLVTDIHTVLTDFPDIEAIRERSVRLHSGMQYSPEALQHALAFGGFEQVDFVASTGEYAVRGGILDVFPVGRDTPLRIEFFGDDIESIREFDAVNQRSTAILEEISFVTSLFLDSDETTRRRMNACFASDAVIVAMDSELLQNAGEAADTVLTELHERHASIRLSVIEQPGTAIVDLHALPQPPMNGSVTLLMETIAELNAKGMRVLLVADTDLQAQRLEDLLHAAIPDDDAVTPELEYEIHTCPLSAGFILPAQRIALLTEHQIFSRMHVQRRSRKGVKGLSLRQMRQLRPGDFVVHTDKGIGRFIGFRTITVNGGLQETTQLEYADGDLLYVNLNYINKLQKYSSEEGATPALSKLGSGAWDRTKERTRRYLKDMARELITLYAKRKMSVGHAFSPDSQWQKEMEASFMYEDTPDQASATEDVKRDMENSVPMDRLVCGDVGYGKTEVAVRAAFKAVVDGKQVALLTPTTILTEQHYNTFRDRLGRYAVSIESLSRFKSKKEQQQVLDKLAHGSIDIVIGTHRLLSKDVSFKTLGLLIIDEEHRFGVAAKERLRQFRANIDTITMTATPIPRTLNFSLLGARDLSVIETPPKNRLPVITHIVPFEEDVVTEGIQRELQRGGQVFFVNDSIADLEYLADKIRVWVPEVRIGIAHGQMKASDLERNMLRFIEKKIDVLVATKIIESGLDIPNANTIYINMAHHFGLAELYQLRGRVGRSNIQAYAYLLVPPKAGFTRDAMKRLQAIEEFGELGAGFQLAMRDLEIRGAGNLLGAEQSGFITEIGFDLYMSMLDEAVQELKEEEFKGLFDEKEQEFRPRNDVVMELGMDAYLPHSYVSNAAERFDIYKRLYNGDCEDDIDAMEKELLDRFGALPREAGNLLYSVRMRLIAARIHLARVTLEKDRLNIALPPEDDQVFYDFHLQPLMSWVLRNPGRLRLEQDSRQIRIIVKDVYTTEQVQQLLEEMQGEITMKETQEHTDA
jgi:transcription-repair coupling factor (superfamily II helicase)